MPRLDITGHLFGRLTATRFCRVEKEKAVWSFLCACGTEVEARANDVRSGNTKSCGCLNKERVLAAVTSHTSSYTSTYNIWRQMRQRCANKKHKSYAYYGGRGISVCPRWDNFNNFFADMGERPAGLTLERIDNRRGYGPDNCKWATWLEQAQNKREMKGA